ncbi:MAG: thiamine pyrophosphate-binding protein [Desulfobaccales bacterium]|jgi:acetolactate synthase-1/2/3 large subunit
METTAYLLEAFRIEGLSHVFLVPGGLIDPFLPALSATAGITPIVACHEGGAAYMADGYARASGRFGACFAIGGPGITNMVTAIAAACTDQSSVMVVSGQVPSDWEGRGGFQDSSPVTLNDVALLQPLTRSSLAVENPHLTNYHLRASFMKMLASPQGPVHISLPLDIQRTEVRLPWDKLDASVYSPRFVDLTALEKLWQILLPGDSQPAPFRIVALAGAGVEKSGAHRDLLAFAERFEIPVATTLRAKGVFPEDHRLSLGIFGYAGHRPAIETILSGEIEVLLVLGSGLSQRDTLFWDRKMLPRRALIHVDLDPKVIGRTWHTEVPLVGDCGQVLRYLLEAQPPRLAGLAATNQERRAWLENLRSTSSRYYDEENTNSEAVPLHPARVLRDLRRVAPRETVLLVDSGAHRAFCGHYWEAYEPRTYLSATNLGPMGWAIPAGIGAKLARPERPLVVVTGDGCMLMHGMEIQTSARYGIPVIFLVINNSALGNVWLRASREGPGPAGLTELPTHDWAGFARSLGLRAATVTAPADLERAFQAALAAGAPYLLDVRCDRAFTTPVTPYNQAKKEWVDND